MHRSHDIEGTGQHFATFQIMHFLVNASSPQPWDVAISNLWYIGHMMSRVLGNILCDLDSKVKVK